MRPYADRLAVTFEVEDDESVHQIASRGARELGLQGWAAEPRWLGFYRPEDATSVPPAFALSIPAVDDLGKARWIAPPHEVPYAALLRAANEGFLYGDPARLHIALVPPVGDGVLPDWQTIVHALEILKTVGEVLAIPGGVAASWAVFASRLDRESAAAAAVIDEHSSVWSRRGADPYAFEEWLAGGAWSPVQISSHLECSDKEAEAILWAFGFEERKDGMWRQDGEEEAKYLADNMRMMIRMSIGQAEDQQLREEFARRARRLVDTGKAPPIDWQELNWLKPSSPIEDEFEKVRSRWWAGRGTQLTNWLRRRFR